MQLRCPFSCCVAHRQCLPVDFGQDRTLSATFADLVSVRQSIADYEKLEAQFKQTIQQAMGDLMKGRTSFSTFIPIISDLIRLFPPERE